MAPTPFFFYRCTSVKLFLFELELNKNDDENWQNEFLWLRFLRLRSFGQAVGPAGIAEADSDVLDASHRVDSADEFSFQLFVVGIVDDVLHQPQRVHSHLQQVVSLVGVIFF